MEQLQLGDGMRQILMEQGELVQATAAADGSKNRGGR